MSARYLPADVTAENVEEVVRWCVAVGDMHTFYSAPAWERLRAEVLEEQHHECQRCKARGRYRRAVIVHHELYVRQHPHLALCKTYTDAKGQTQRQLTAVCRDCHHRIHSGDHKHKPRYSNEERWD